MEMVQIMLFVRLPAIFVVQKSNLDFLLNLEIKDHLLLNGQLQDLGCAFLTKNGMGPYITHITPGKIVDMGIKDSNNMGAAMAPAALDTIITHFKDTGRNPSYYDAIITGDLGDVGKEILNELALSKGYNMKSNYNDCGVLIFDKEKQDVHSGGSGCGCCASVFSGFLFNQLKQKKLKKILLVATGALTNATTAQQGESIPGIAHAVSIEI